MKTSAWTLATLIALSSSIALAEEVNTETPETAPETTAVIQTEATSTEQPTEKKLFEKLDTDKDGQISLDEAQNYPTLVKGFDKVDSDKNGFLSPEEFTRPRLKS
jgi:Ca2+-binding EF-hand superfamily protein